MDFEATSGAFRLGSPPASSDRLLGASSSANRRSSFTEYRPLLSSSLFERDRERERERDRERERERDRDKERDRLSSPPSKSTYAAGRADDHLPSLFGAAGYNSTSKYNSANSTTTKFAASAGLHLDDNLGALHHKYSFLEEPHNSSATRPASEHISGSSLLAGLGSGAYTAASAAAATTATTCSALSKYSTSLTGARDLELAQAGSIGAASLSRASAGGKKSAAAAPTEDEQLQVNELVDSIEIPARGRCKVFMAKYGYDPFKQSPNENPDAELAFNAGDYIMVFDDLDEDGYFIGELMDGRRGYVPSNWLYRLTGDDLFEFQASVLYRQAGGGHELNGCFEPTDSQRASLVLQGSGLCQELLQLDEGQLGAADGPLGQSNSNNNNNYPPEFYDAIISDTMNHSNFQHLLAPEDYHRMNDYVDLDDVNEVDDECLSDYERAEAEQMRRAVPPPQRLVLERQLNKCILIAWLHPQAAKGTIVSYQVYVDGVLKSTVPSGDRTKALLEGVDSNIPHRISVRAIDMTGRHSNDAGCTIVIGHKIPFAPSCVKASHITSDSALISWLPCNSNFHHVVAVNSVEVQTVRPGVYKHLINGLSANTLYRVWVRAKPGKILSIDEKNPNKLDSLTTYVDFKTMPKSLPDPPVNVQVEAGPQRRTLLVTWLPLTLNDYGGSSNGCAVTGYAVFAGHKKLAEIDSPTGDHALLDIADLESLHKKSVTVRTKSGENLSQDSMPCQIPDEYLKQAAGGGGGSSHGQSSGSGARHGQPPVQSASRHRPLNQPAATGGLGAANSPRRYNLAASQQQQHARRSRPLARSLHNLESDAESRRSSIPPYDAAALNQTSGSELMNQTESYSEEEFESSMRFRGASSRGRALGNSSRASAGHQQLNRLRARQSHSMDGANQLFGQNQTASRGHLQQRHGFRPMGAAGSSGTPMGEVRFFVALFDYDPSTMSPNPNAAAEELAFKEGSIIKVYGGLGEDGFYKGELLEGGQASGFVPCNVISEITDANLLGSLYEKGGAGAGPQQVVGPSVNPRQQQHLQEQASAGTNPVLASQQTQAAGGGGAVKRMVALYDYDPQENSPNADTESEIPFKTGDIIFVYGKMDTDGFYMGEVERTKQRGLVPSNFLREEPLAKQVVQQQQQHLMQMQMQQQMMPKQLGQFGAGQQNAPANYSAQPLRASQPNLIRGSLGPQSVGHQQAQNISRPNSLSLGAQNMPQQQQHMMMMNNQQMALQQLQQNGLAQQAGQQQLANSFAGVGQSQMPPGQFAGSNVGRVCAPMQQNQAQQQQQFQGLLNQQQMNAMMQQQEHAGQQQQQQGGVLSNLLSSGKQIIGAATTPRAPNQPGAFPVGQPMAGQAQQQARNMMLANNQLVDNPNAGGQNFNSRVQQQQQPLGMGHAGNMNMGANMNMGMMGNQQQQQPHSFNQMGGGGNFGRPGGMSANSMATNSNQMGEEQGANLLNTVKNMFKL